MTNLFVCPKCRRKLSKSRSHLICNKCKYWISMEDSVYNFFISDQLPEIDVKTGKFFNRIFKLFSSNDRTETLETISLEKLFGLGRKEFINKSILDAGTGFGRIPKEICKYNPKLIIGMDLAEDSLKIARKFVKDNRVLFVRADLNHAPFAQESFDWVISLGVIHHIHDFEKSLINLVGLCRPNGKMIIAVLGKQGLINYLRRFIRIFSLMIPYSLAEKLIIRLPVSSFMRYTISDILWAPIYHQRSFREMENLLNEYGMEKVEKLDIYKNNNKIYRFLMGEGYMHILSKKKDID